MKRITQIAVQYVACDGHRDLRTFKTLSGASRFARRMLGDYPEFGPNYAVSEDGVGTLYVSGDADLRDLFDARL